MTKRDQLSASGLKHAKPGKYFDGDGLFAVKTETGGYWYVRLMVGGKRCDMGLGRLSDVSLKVAREKARDAKARAADGYDPIQERKERKAALHAETRAKKEEQKRKGLTFAGAFDAVYKKHVRTLKNSDGRSWASPMNSVLDAIGDLPVVEVDHHRVAGALEPIWEVKHPTARKALRITKQTLAHGRVATGELTINPELIVADTLELLGPVKHKGQNHKAMAFGDVPEFFANLGDDVGERALRLLILTGVRAGVVCKARSDQFDLENAIWTVPAELNKMDREFRVPLSPAALAVIAECPEGLLFPNQLDRPISDAKMSNITRPHGVTPHGFRSSLREFLVSIGAPEIEAELCLDHDVKSKVQGAYDRGDRLDARRPLMERWALHVAGEAADVVNLEDRRRG